MSRYHILIPELKQQALEAYAEREESTPEEMLIAMIDAYINDYIKDHADLQTGANALREPIQVAEDMF